MDDKVYYYLKDLTGLIIGLYNEEDKIVVNYVYDAWGKHKVYNDLMVNVQSSEFIGNINLFRYKGYYYDVETQLFWLSSRYYSAELCRFISPDDVDYLAPSSINGLNLYCYCMNNPIMYYDPSGHFVITTAMIWAAKGIGAAIGAGIGLGATVVKDLENGKITRQCNILVICR